MEENKVAKALKVVGWITIIFGIIGAFVLGATIPEITVSSYGRIDESFNWGLTLGVMAGSIVSGILFLGFAEIIHLLQSNVNKMDKIISSIDSKEGRDPRSAEKSIVDDIESNLPKL